MKTPATDATSWCAGNESRFKHRSMVFQGRASPQKKPLSITQGAEVLAPLQALFAPGASQSAGRWAEHDTEFLASLRIPDKPPEQPDCSESRFSSQNARLAVMSLLHLPKNNLALRELFQLRCLTTFEALQSRRDARSSRLHWPTRSSLNWLAEGFLQSTRR